MTKSKEPDNRILIIVDMQRDFLLEDGKLFIGHDTSELRKKVAEFAGNFNGHVIVVRDVHRPGSCEFDLFGEHCLLADLGSSVVDEILEVWSFHWIPVWKESFSSRTLVDKVFEVYLTGTTEIHVVGVCTHICVHDVVADVVNYIKNMHKEIPKVIIHGDMIDDFDEEMASFALRRMQNLYDVIIECGGIRKRRNPPSGE
jgi:nicotinamidase-related amidase